MTKLRVLSLFAGIGGFDLGLERTGGFETVAFCEIDPHAQAVLRKHWPEVPIYDDVTNLTGERLFADGIAVDCIVGGFPCQDISSAGKQAGIRDGTRSGLWSEVARLIGELRPRYVIVENVANLLAGPSEQPGGWFGRVLGDLAECGYDAEWENIPASALGASHRRERVWIVAYPQGNGQLQCGAGDQGRNAFAPRIERVRNELGGNGAGGGAPVVAHTNVSGLEGRAQAGDAGRVWPRLQQLIERCANDRGAIWPTEPRVGRVAHGVPGRMDRLKQLGNAVVPQIPELIGNAILASMREQKEAA